MFLDGPLFSEATDIHLYCNIFQDVVLVEKLVTIKGLIELVKQWSIIIKKSYITTEWWLFFVLFSISIFFFHFVLYCYQINNFPLFFLSFLWLEMIDYRLISTASGENEFWVGVEAEAVHLSCVCVHRVRGFWRIVTSAEQITGILFVNIQYPFCGSPIL